MVNYKLTIFLTILVAIIAIIAIKTIDEYRLQSLSNQISSSMLEGDSTRLLLMYPQVFKLEDDKEICKIIDFNTKNQLDKEFNLVNLLKTYQDANLLSDYNITRESYYLSNIELWFYITQGKEMCNKSNIVPILFFYTTETQCPDCIVQGQILDSIREKCKNLRIITVATDLNIEIIELVKEQYNITSVPSLVINNKKVINGLVDEGSILDGINCENQ